MHAYPASAREVSDRAIATMWPVVLGFLVLYVPTLLTMARELWGQDEYGHGPMILAVAGFLLWRGRNDVTAQSGKGKTVLGLLISLIGLLMYVLGSSQEILMLQVGSAPWVIAGLVLMFYGPVALKRIWFPLFFMLFMMPLPGSLVEAVTMPMKMAASYVAENLLYLLGYPIARSGVILQIGQYKLFVADACAGLHTLLTLEAMGLLYLAVVRHSSLARNLTLACLIVPISFTANVLRIITLILVTYYLGDEAGQGFLHGFAGIVLFLSALLLIVGVDTALKLRFPGE
jgi:exosortase B